MSKARHKVNIFCRFRLILLLFDVWYLFSYPHFFKPSLGRMRSVYSKSRAILEPKPIFRMRLQQFSRKRSGNNNLFKPTNNVLYYLHEEWKTTLTLSAYSLNIRFRWKRKSIKSHATCTIDQFSSCTSDNLLITCHLQIWFQFSGIRYEVRYEICIMTEVCATRYETILKDLRYNECRTLYTVRGMRYAVWGTRYAVRGTRYEVWRHAVGGMRYAVGGMRYAVGGMRYAVGGIRYAIRGMRYADAVWGMRYAVWGMRYAVWGMATCGRRYEVCGTRFEVCGTRYEVCGRRYEVCGTRDEV